MAKIGVFAVTSKSATTTSRGTVYQIKMRDEFLNKFVPVVSEVEYEAYYVDTLVDLGKILHQTTLDGD